MSGFGLTLKGVLRKSRWILRPDWVRFTIRRYIGHRLWIIARLAEIEDGDLDITERLRMQHKDVDGEVLFSTFVLSELLGIRGSLVREIILKFFSTLRFIEGILDLDTADTFQGQAPEKVTTTDLFFLYNMDEGMVVNVPYLLAQYLFRHACGRKVGAQMFGDQFIAHLGIHFVVIMEQSLQTLTVKVCELPTTDPEELTRLRICERLIDIVAWVVVGPQRQQVGAAGRAVEIDPEAP
ncbi:hypothetical protein Tco_0729937 [Tanacetum coccineum]|uniref:Uncharacterized protein n=1 Tax=Tanacetum coccineum TaxID=301880 RepID=A0ABQ4YSS3_9ASTR